MGMANIFIKKSDRSILVTVREKKNYSFCLMSYALVGLLVGSLLFMFECHYNIVLIVGLICIFLLFNTFRKEIIEESVLIDLNTSLIKLVKISLSGQRVLPRVIPLV